MRYRCCFHCQLPSLQWVARLTWKIRRSYNMYALFFFLGRSHLLSSDGAPSLLHPSSLPLILSRRTHAQKHVPKSTRDSVPPVIHFGLETY